MDKMKKVSILVPFFNEEESLPIHLNEVLAFIKELEKKYEFEVLLLDNHSSDRSSEFAKDASKKYPFVKWVRHSRNFGYQANILAGYKECTGDCAVQLDADGEDDPKIISEFISNWENGYKVVYGVRIKREESWFMTLQRKIFYRLLASISDVPIPVDAGDFRLVDRTVIDILNQFTESNVYIRGLLSYAGFKQVGIPYARRPRHFGISKFSYINYLSLGLDGVTSFSKKPLSFIALFGLGLSLISGIFFFVYIGLYLAGKIEVRGFTTLLAFQLLFSGVQLLSLGVVAIYIGRIFDEVKKRPHYVVEERS
jgi:glycosyltransferase involved in cell wall biosynthesis